MGKTKGVLLASLILFFSLGFISAIDISNCLELNATRDNLAGDYVLTQNIDCSDTVNWNGGFGFLSIGTRFFNETSGFYEYEAFTGTFDGQNYTINNLFMANTADFSIDSDAKGLFAYVNSSATISNVGIVDANITGSQYVGALVGVLEDSATVSNSYSTGSISGFRNIGGLVGMVNNATVYRSYSNTSLSVDVNKIGGLVGELGYFGVINQSYSDGNIVSLESDDLGGLVGEFFNGTISDSYSLTDINAGGQIGGFAGQLITSNASLDNSYSAGSVNGSSDVGGFIGLSSGIVSNSFWDINTSGQTVSAAGTGRNTTLMKTQSTFTDAGWDFTNVWDINSSLNNGYPFLRWQNTSSLENPPDTTPPIFTSIPSDESITLPADWDGVDFDATDETSFDSFSVNNSNFTINSTGFLDNSSVLVATSYHLNVSINDTSGNTNFTVFVLTVNPASSGSGNGGSSGSSSTSSGTSSGTSVSSYFLDVSELDIGIKTETYNLYEVTIENNGTTSLTLPVSQTGLDGRIEFSSNTLSIGPGETEILGVTILGLSELGNFSGSLSVGSETIPVSLNVERVSLSFDPVISIKNSAGVLAIGDVLGISSMFLSKGDNVRVKVNLSYFIKDENGSIVFSEEEMVFSDGGLDIENDFNVSSLPPGDYSIEIEMIYPGGVSPSSANFKILDSARAVLFARILFYLINAILVALVILLFLILSRFIFPGRDHPLEKERFIGLGEKE